MVERAGTARARLPRRWRHVVLGICLLAAIILVGWVGYVLLGFGALDALYQTVTTITTVGFP